MGYHWPYIEEMKSPTQWIADRAKQIEMSGIRKVFDLGRSLKNPCNLSIGQPHFEVPAPIREAAKAAIDSHKNGYTVTQGDAAFRSKLLADVAMRFPGHDRDVIVTSGTSGGLLLALLATVNPGDEVVVCDPYFVAYPMMVTLAAGVLKTVDTYPTFQPDVAKIEAALTPKTKVVILCSPANPTGAMLKKETLKAVAELCRDRGILLISDEIYRAFCYDGDYATAGSYDPNVLVIEGFGKTYGITGWRLGYAHGPKAIIDEMLKLQQCTFVCAPSIVQHAGIAAMDFDVTGIVSDYKRKRDLLVAGLKDRFEFNVPGGAFYLFPKTPWGTGTEFVHAGIVEQLLTIPGGVFSQRDTHFRISYAAADETLHRGIEILNKLAKR
jgi:aspartate aminotransferase/aminotransferase